MKTIELSLPFNFSSKKTSEILEVERPYIKWGHFGTHLDLHLKSDIPLEYIYSKGIIIDGRKRHFDEDEINLTEIEKNLISEHSFVLFYTGQIEKYHYGSKDYFYKHPQLGQQCIEFLSQANIRFVGIDAAGVRRGQEHVVADKLLESKSIYVIENLINLSDLYQYTCNHQYNFNIHCMWWNHAGMTGIPCRVVASF